MPSQTHKKSHRALQRARKREDRSNPSSLSPRMGSMEPRPTHRGRRSIQTHAARRAQLIEKIYNTTDAVSIVLDAYPGEFDRVPTNGAIVRRKISKLFPHEPSTYAAPPTDVPLKATLSPKLTKELSPEHPHHLLIRGEPGEISLDVGTRLFEAYKRLIACPGLSWPAEKGKNRSSSSAFHLGVWGIVSKAPFITHDTRQADPDARALMNDFLAIIRDEVAPLIARIIQFHLPNVWVTQQRAYAHVKANHAQLRDQFGQWEYVDFGGAFFAVAARIGSSSRPHIDFNDFKYSMSWVLAFGDYGGAEFVCPQLGLRVPLAPGQPLGCMTRLLAHYGTEVTYGERLVLTMFTDHFIIGQSVQSSQTSM